MQSKNRPIIWICHSLGGIVVKAVSFIYRIFFVAMSQLTLEIFAGLTSCKTEETIRIDFAVEYWNNLSWDSTQREF
jgi:hypothetical protein